MPLWMWEQELLIKHAARARTVWTVWPKPSVVRGRVDALLIIAPRRDRELPRSMPVVVVVVR